MSKLAQVRKALQENPKIIIVSATEENYLSNGPGYPWGHTVDFYVAPKTNGIYSVQELQTLMASLIPGLEPTSKDDFQESKREIEFGKLYFDEDIGTEIVHREVVLTDADVLSSAGFVDCKQITDAMMRIKRRIWVNLFPSVKIAALALATGKKYRIFKNELPRSVARSQTR